MRCSPRTLQTGYLGAAEAQRPGAKTAMKVPLDAITLHLVLVLVFRACEGESTKGCNLISHSDLHYIRQCACVHERHQGVAHGYGLQRM